MVLPEVDQRSTYLPPASPLHHYAVLIAGRVPKDDESKKEFDQYKSSFLLNPDTEILWDYPLHTGPGKEDKDEDNDATEEEDEEVEEEEEEDQY